MIMQTDINLSYGVIFSTKGDKIGAKFRKSSENDSGN